MAEPDPQKTFNIHAAKSQLSRLVERAYSGEEIVIARAGEPRAKLVPIAPITQPTRRAGDWPALGDIPLSVWSEPLSEEELAFIDDRPVGKRH